MAYYEPPCTNTDCKHLESLVKKLRAENKELSKRIQLLKQSSMLRKKKNNMLTKDHVFGCFEIDGLFAWTSVVSWKMKDTGEPRTSPLRIIFAKTREEASDKHLEWVMEGHQQVGMDFEAETRSVKCLFPAYFDEIEVTEDQKNGED